MNPLPRGWSFEPLASIVDPDKPIVYGIIQAGPEFPGGVPYIKSSDVGASLDLTSLSRTAPEIAQQYERAATKPGDIVFSLRGNIGELSIVPEGFPTCNLTQGTARISPRRDVDVDFLAAALHSPGVQRRIQTVAKGSTFREISLEELRLLEIPIPTVQEQRRIAAVLKTWDDAIGALDRLYAKLIDRRAALRNAVFGERNAGETLAPLSEVTSRVSRVSDGADHPLMTIASQSGFVLQSDKYARYMAGESAEAYTLLRRGEFAYNKGNSLTYPQGCVFRLDRDSALVPFVYFCFGLNEGLNADYYAQLFAAGHLNAQLARLIKTGVRNNGLLNINSDDFFSCLVPVPPLSQQARDAAILNDADAEIRAVETEIAALKMQKRGLMQKLLTGAWRVPASEKTVRSKP